MNTKQCAGIKKKRLYRLIAFVQGVFQDLEMGGVPQPLGVLPFLHSPSPPFPPFPFSSPPSTPLPVEVGPRFAARGSGGAYALVGRSCSFKLRLGPL